MDDAKVSTPIHALLSLKLRKCESVRCLDEKGFSCAPIFGRSVRSFYANDLVVLHNITL